MLFLELYTNITIKAKLKYLIKFNINKGYK